MSIMVNLRVLSEKFGFDGIIMGLVRVKLIVVSLLRVKGLL